MLRYALLIILYYIIIIFNLSFSYYDAEQSNYVTAKYHGKEDIYIDNVKLCGTLNSNTPRRACITFRIPVCIIHFFVINLFNIIIKMQVILPEESKCW